MNLKRFQQKTVAKILHLVLNGTQARWKIMWVDEAERFPLFNLLAELKTCNSVKVAFRLHAFSVQPIGLNGDILRDFSLHCFNVE